MYDIDKIESNSKIKLTKMFELEDNTIERIEIQPPFDRKTGMYDFILFSLIFY